MLPQTPPSQVRVSQDSAVLPVLKLTCDHTFQMSKCFLPRFAITKRDRYTMYCSGALTSESAHSNSEKMVESWESIMKPQTRANYVDRWDWHAWQFLAALVPSFSELPPVAQKPDSQRSS